MMMHFRILILFGCVLQFFELTNAFPNINLIVGGQYANPNEYPFAVSMQYNGYHFCGGSILNKKYIITAAHCFDVDINHQNVEILTGTSNLACGGVRYRLNKVINYYGYSAEKHFGDVALVKIVGEMSFNEATLPITIHKDVSSIRVGSSVTIVGWGDEKTNGETPDHLKYNTVSLMSDSDCSRLTGIDGLYCLKHPAGQSACTGDSGSAAVYCGKLIGVMDNIINSCESDKANLYARISILSDWIKSEISK